MRLIINVKTKKRIAPVLLTLVLAVMLATLRSAFAHGSTNTELARLMTDEDARHLLVRTGIGAAPSDIRELRGLTRQQAIDFLLDGFQRESEIAMPDWVNAPLPHYHARQDMDDNARARFNAERDAELSQLRQWWVMTMLETSSPQTERMVLFWHDLFATSYGDTDRQSLAMARQNQTFRRLGMGSWDTLLKAMIRDPALLEFLDSGSNHKEAPNENLARELLELFILGEGNYSEEDVKNAARALTGHDVSRIRNLSFRRKSWVQDRGDKTLFGVTGQHDGDALINLALAQPAAAEFLVVKFWHAFIADAAPQKAWVDHYAARFRQSEFRIDRLYRDVLESRAFWHEQYRGAMVKSPVDLIAGTARSLEYPKTHWREFPLWQAELGMSLFAPPNVSGWREGAAFVTTGRLLNRYRLLDALVTDTASPHGSTVAMMMDADAETLNAEGNAPENMNMPVETSPMPSHFSVRMAAEDFQGPAKFQVSLNNDNAALWTSETMSFKGGHDTEVYGRIGNQSDLSWQRLRINAPAKAIKNSNRIDIRYLNDAAGPGGDRNLYVDGVHIDEHWLPGSEATQNSDCVPALAANAWKLYCAGTLSFVRSSSSDVDSVQLPAWRAAAAHVQWANNDINNDRLTVYLTLDHLVTPSRQYHTLQFSVQFEMDKGYAQLRLESFGCWPDCVARWPHCAWLDDHFPDAKTLSFAWISSNDLYWKDGDGAACHLHALESNERALVATLWRSLPALVKHVAGTSRGQRFAGEIEQLNQLLEDRTLLIRNTPYHALGGTIQVNVSYAPAQSFRELIAGPVVRVSSASMLARQMAQQQMDMRSVLTPAINVAGLPALDIDKAATATEQLNAIVKHPLFQVK